MALKHAVLGLILDRRGYGYELVKRLEGRLGPAYPLNPSAVYGALDQLEREELICGVLGRGEEASARPLSRRPRRVVYEPTPAGEAAFAAWLAVPSTSAGSMRSELRLKVAVSRREDAPALLVAVEHEEMAVRRAYEECEAASRPAGMAESSWSTIATELAHSAGLVRLRGQLGWIESVRATLALVTETPPG